MHQQFPDQFQNRLMHDDHCAAKTTATVRTTSNSQAKIIQIPTDAKLGVTSENRLATERRKCRRGETSTPTEDAPAQVTPKRFLNFSKPLPRIGILLPTKPLSATRHKKPMTSTLSNFAKRPTAQSAPTPLQVLFTQPNTRNKNSRNNIKSVTWKTVLTPW